VDWVLMTEQTGQQGAPQALPEPDWYKNPPSWWNSGPPRNQPPPWQGQGQQGPSNYDIMTAIQGAPEKIVMAIREATKQVAPPAQQPPPPPPAQQPPPQQQQQQNDNPPREKTFAEKWYGL
jgi:hypothetical protein